MAVHHSEREIAARRLTYRRFGAAVVVGMPLLVVGINLSHGWLGEGLLLVDSALLIYGGRVLLFDIDHIHHEMWTSGFAYGRAGNRFSGAMLLGFGVVAGVLALINLVRYGL
jgi:hypothetical protein